MPSRADRRRAGELVLRAALIGALGVALWRSTRPAIVTSGVHAASASTLSRDAGRTIADNSLRAVDVTMDAMPTSAERDMLVALRRAGVGVQWHGSPPAIALEAARVREPDERTRMLVIAGTPVVALVDSVGVLDSVRAKGGATIDAASVVGAVRAEQGRFIARTTPSSATARRAVLVLGRAEWESKFVMSALTEAGWIVRARIPLAPNVVVADDGVLPIDTARYDAVVALDSSAADLAPQLARFVASGGGLVVEGEALALEPLRALAPAGAGARAPARILLADDSVTPRDLPLRALAALRTDAVTLERQPAGAALAARRSGLGRVLAVGYDESWRWRMLGGETGLAAHRRWWSAAVGSVAPERSAAAPAGGDAAPLASLLDALGPPSSAATPERRSPVTPLPFVLLIVIAAALLAETASRRFRGGR